jgi:hypothetical protein
LAWFPWIRAIRWIQAKQIPSLEKDHPVLVDNLGKIKSRIRLVIVKCVRLFVGSVLGVGASLEHPLVMAQVWFLGRRIPEWGLVLVLVLPPRLCPPLALALVVQVWVLLVSRLAFVLVGIVLSFEAGVQLTLVMLELEFCVLLLVLLLLVVMVMVMVVVLMLVLMVLMVLMLVLMVLMMVLMMVLSLRLLEMEN